MKRFALGMVLFLSAVFVACSSEEPPDSSPPAPLTATVKSADGVAIEYEVRGAGPVALVFIHGWICDRTHWRHQVDAFAGGHTVVTLDLAGHGNSGKNRDDWTAEDLKATFDHLYQRALIETRFCVPKVSDF